LMLMQRGSGIMKLVNGRSQNGCRIVELSSGIEDGWSYAEIALILAAVSLEAADVMKNLLASSLAPFPPVHVTHRSWLSPTIASQSGKKNS
jgi:hypothetical protein